MAELYSGLLNSAHLNQGKNSLLFSYHRGPGWARLIVVMTITSNYPKSNVKVTDGMLLVWVSVLSCCSSTSLKIGTYLIFGVLQWIDKIR